LLALANVLQDLSPVASLGLVSPGAATDGVALFFLEKLTTFFSHRPLKSDYFFGCRLLTTPILPRRLPCYEALLHRYCLTYLLVLMRVLVVIHQVVIRHCPYSSIVVVLCPWRAAAALRFTELSRRCWPPAEHVMSHRRFVLSEHVHVCQMLTDR